MNFKKALSLFLLLSLSTQSFAVSIAQLIEQGKIPAIQEKDMMLNLSGLGIDSLVGLGDILRIGEVRGLALNDNLLPEIPSGVLGVCTSLKALSVKNNKISYIAEDALVGLNQLEAIYLENNKLALLEGNPFANLPQLKLIALRNNKLPKTELQRLQKALPNTNISTSLITRRLLITVGVIAVGIALAVGAALRAGGYFESLEDKDIRVEASIEVGESFKNALQADLERVRKKLATVNQRLESMPIPLLLPLGYPSGKTGDERTRLEDERSRLIKKEREVLGAISREEKELEQLYEERARIEIQQAQQRKKKAQRDL